MRWELCTAQRKIEYVEMNEDRNVNIYIPKDAQITLTNFMINGNVPF